MPQKNIEAVHFQARGYAFPVHYKSGSWSRQLHDHDRPISSSAPCRRWWIGVLRNRGHQSHRHHVIEVGRFEIVRKGLYTLLG
jgi:hypothetical protein